MKKIIYIISILTVGIFMFHACDIIEEPYLKPIGNSGNEPDEKVRKVLLEEYTGHKCPNCPEGAELAHSLQSVYGEKLVILSVHAGWYANFAATGLFTMDFRTEAGSEWNDFFVVGPTGYPAGIVNRREYQGSTVLSKDEWEPAIAEIIDDSAPAVITISNTFNTGTRDLVCRMETEFLENLDSTYNICAVITESGIIAPQQTEDGIDTTYEHNHVLRASMNGIWGELVGADGLAVTGDISVNEYTFNIPAGWNADNCRVVAFVFSNETNEVIQAEEEAIK